MRTLIAVLLLLCPSLATAQCKLSAPKPLGLAKELLHRQSDSDMPWGYLSVILDPGQPKATLLDLADVKRHVEVGSWIKYGVYTASRPVTLTPGEKLFAGGKLVLESRSISSTLDAVDGKGGETWVAYSEREREGGPKLLRVDAAGKASAPIAVARGQVTQARLVRLTDGRLAYAWISVAGGDYLRVTSLWLAFFDAAGKAAGAPQRLDAVALEQQLADIALAPSGSGALVAWDPIARPPEKRAKEVAIEVRAFHVEPGAAPVLVRRDPLKSAVWSVPGAAGGYLPNGLQAAVSDGRPVLLWTTFDGESEALTAAPGEGGPPAVLSTQPPGSARLRTVGAEAVVVFWDRNSGEHQRATVACPAVASPPKPAALDALPVEPSYGKLTPADLDRAWAQALKLAAEKPEALAELKATTPDEKKEALEQLEENRMKSQYECVMAATSLDALRPCHWP